MTPDDRSSRSLHELASSAQLPPPSAPATATGITTDSRTVTPGSLFVAYRGLQSDGNQYVAAAVERGATAVVAERAPAEPLPVPLILVPDGRIAWARLEAAWRGFPGRRMRLAGVTGTDGKTTTSTLLRHILHEAGRAVGLISTLGASIGADTLDTGLHTSTPPPSQVQELLLRMVEAGCQDAVLESTSEGLAQHRLEAVDFDTAVLTNLTHDHLYYHGAIEAYRTAKGMLFQTLSASWRKAGVVKVAVLNRDDPSYPWFAQFPADQRLTYGAAPDADMRLGGMRAVAGGTVTQLDTPWGEAELQLPLVGAYNAWNAAAAIIAACAWDVPLDIAIEACRSFQGVPGRMETIDAGQPFTAIVDFAHTENALRQALTAARAFTPGRIIVAFGCAGERDVAKRGPMAQTAVQLADVAIFTAEDPRTEPVCRILARMEQGAQAVGAAPGRDYLVEPVRQAAIDLAVSLAQPGDTVLVCGKGHEQSMAFGRVEYPWDDRAATRRALANRGYPRGA